MACSSFAFRGGGGKAVNLEPEVCDVSLLIAPMPRGLGLDLEQAADALKRNPETLTKDVVAYLSKKRCLTNLPTKIMSVRKECLPNVVRAVGRLLALCNPHNRK